MTAGKPYQHYHKDGSLWATGRMDGKTMVGKWTWYRKGGTKMRSGTFTNGKQTGEWITYDRHGRIVKKTIFKDN